MVQRFSHCSLFHYIIVCWHKPVAPKHLTGVPFWFWWWPFLYGSYRTYLLSCHKQYVTDRRVLGIYSNNRNDRETSQCVRQEAVLIVIHRFCVRCMFKHSDNISYFSFVFSFTHFKASQSKTFFLKYIQLSAIIHWMIARSYMCACIGASVHILYFYYYCILYI